MSARTLDTPDVEALKARVAEAKSRGWQQSHLKRYFESVGVQYPDYVAATTGKEVSRSVADELASVAVVGLPKWPFAPNADDIRKHIDWLIKPALGAYDDALIEIAHDGPDGRLTGANLFGLDQIDEAVAFAVARNKDARNVYIGAALRLPDADRKKRSSGEDFYVATAVPIDIDTDYDATRANMAAICDDGLVVTTGLTPSRRSQHWARLLEPCESELEFGHAFRALVECVGADMKVKDAARVMRLAGTIAFPSARKIGAGYCMELTVASVNDAAKPSDIETLKALSPQETPTERRDYSHRPQNDGIEREGILGTGKVVDGRERFFATKLLPRAIREYQDAHGCDPDADELFEAAFAKFVEEADNTDQRWTSPEGRKELRARAANTLRRLRIGRMAHIGLASIDTGIGREEAEAAQAAWEETRKAQEPPQSARGGEGKREQAKGDDDTFEVLSIADIRALPDAQWIIKDAIPATGLMFVYGPPASFKSFVCYDLALALAYGSASWLGRERKADGSVLYIASEGVTGAKNRIEAWQREHGVSEDTDRFHLIRKTINFLSLDDRERLVRTVARHIEAHGPVSVIFVDTVSRVLPGADENLQKDMTIFVGACDALREFGATVVGVHHTNKQGEMRGSTVFLGQGDAVYRVEREDGRKVGVLTCEKLKDAQDGWKRAFEVREQTWVPPGRIEAVSSLVAVFPDDLEVPDDDNAGDKWPPKETCRAALRDIDAAWQKGQPWSPYARAQTEGKYAVRNISKAFGIKAGVAQMMIEEWQRNGVLTFEIADKKTKAKGLMVAEWPF